MSCSHHGTNDDHNKQSEIMNRFLDQLSQRAVRNYSEGRLGAHDEGDLAFAVAADPKKNVVIVDFGKPVQWMAFPPEQVNELINLLMTKLRDLGVPATISV